MKAFANKPLLKSIFHFMVCGLIVAMTCEVATRIIFNKELNSTASSYDVQNQSIHPYIMFKGQPNRSSGLRDFDDNYIYYNKLGYRGPVPEKTKNPEEFRIFLIGGSSVFGHYRDPASLLQEEFNKSGFQNIRVFNFGFPSSGSGEDLARITYEISDYKPDLIVTYSGANDFEHPFYADPRPGYTFNFLVHESNPLLQTQFDQYNIVNHALYSSAFLRHFFKDYFWKNLLQQDQLRVREGYKSFSWKKKIVTNYIGNLRKSHQMSKGLNSQYLALFQPLIYFKKLRVGHEGESHLPFESEILSMKKEFDRQIQQGPEFSFSDLSGFFKDHKSEFFTDSCHLNLEGKKIIAKHLYNLILPSVTQASKSFKVTHKNE